MPRPRALVAVLSAGIFIVAGITMLSIRSVSGDSVAEAFYQAFGVFSFGFAGAVLLLGFVSFTRDQERQHSRDFMRCVECQEWVYLEATRCPDCGTDLLEAESADRRATK